MGNGGLACIVETSARFQGPKGFPCYACDVRLTLAGSLAGPLMWLLPFVQVQSEAQLQVVCLPKLYLCRLLCLWPESRLCLVPIQSSLLRLASLETTGMVSLTFYVRMLMFLNYGDRNRPSRGGSRVTESHIRSLRAKPLFRLRFSGCFFRLQWSNVSGKIQFYIETQNFTHSPNLYFKTRSLFGLNT